ncbi:MAG: GNAT family N-acetyltransferase [Chitinophagales bacterium]|nr:GNAT family N-acetyltransferase [Chitinophagales bacterium]MCU0393849.1 GNAT family N-acetyltransferase [Thermoflexibacter sp.]
MSINLQPTLQNKLVKIIPLKQEDFEPLYQVASDPLIWEQHPVKTRYQRDVFQSFFDDAMQSEASFLFRDAQNDEIIGNSRYYEYDAVHKSIAIGYTFLARKYWGGVYNYALKSLMIDYAFNFVETIVLHIGESNIRSQKATEKLGAVKVGTLAKEYHGVGTVINFIYHIDKSSWAVGKKS